MSLTPCPHCGASLIDGDTGYHREIGVEIMGGYDGVLYWQCPDCGKTWHRFPEGHYLRTQAERYITPSLPLSHGTESR